MPLQKRIARFLARSTALAVALAVLFSLFLFSRPISLPGAYRFEEEPPEELTHPFKKVENRLGIYTVSFDLFTRSMRPRLYSVEADDCILEMRVNGVPVEKPFFPYCNYPSGAAVDLSRHLTPGTNRVTATVFNHDGFADFSFRVHLLDTLNVWLAVGALLALLWYAQPKVLPKQDARRTRSFLKVFNALLGLCLLLMLTIPMQLSLFAPALTHWEYEFAEGRTVERPLLMLKEKDSPRNSVQTLRLEWEVPRVHYGRYRIIPDNCLRSLHVNGVRFRPLRTPLCGYPEGHTVDLSSLLRPGKNILSAQIWNEQGTASLEIQPAKSDPLFLLYYAAILGLFAFCTFTLLQNTISGKTRAWYAEATLCAGFVLSRLWDFWWQARDARSWDPHAHLEMVTRLGWTHPFPASLYETFYSYHPPFGFLLARTAHLAGLTPLMSIKLVSAAASLAAFFFLRATLRRLRLLERPEGIAFLYITASLPLQIFLSTSLNLDVIILAFASASLYFSVRLFASSKPPALSRTTLPLVAALACTHLLALLTKFNGVLLLALPFLVAACFQFKNLRCSMPELRRVFACAAVAAAAAVALALPYYHLRYYRETGNYLPGNGTHFDRERQERGRKILQRDGSIRYTKRLFEASPPQRVQPNFSDLRANRLHDTWSQLWMRNLYLTLPGRPMSRVSIFYLAVMPYAVSLGFLLFLLQCGSAARSPWRPLGCVFLLFAAVQVGGLILYLFQNPCTECYGTKAIYIAPALWAVGFLLMQPFLFRTFLPKRLQKSSPWVEWVLLLPVVLLLLINHFGPVY